jgi:hypothetical protein
MTGKIVLGGSVAFDELVGSPKISAGRESRSITREGRINWANIDAAILECFPAPPAIWGRHPTATYLYVEKVEIEPFHSDAANWMNCTGNVAYYVDPSGDGYEAKMTVTYSLPPFPDATQLISVKLSVGGQMQFVAPTSEIVWSDSGKVVSEQDAQVMKFIPMIEHSYTRHRAVAIPWVAIRNCIGRVNASTLSVYPFSNVGAETLLMAGAEIGFTYDSGGNAQWTLDYRFNEMVITHDNVDSPPGGWNHVYRKSKSGAKPGNIWVKVKDSTGTSIQYQTTNAFPTLF